MTCTGLRGGLAAGRARGAAGAGLGERLLLRLCRAAAGRAGSCCCCRRCERASSSRCSSLTPFLRPSPGWRCRESCASASQRCSVLASMPRRRQASATETKVIEPLLSCGTDNRNESQPDDLLGKLRGMFLGKGPGSSQENSPEKCWEGQVARPGDLPGFLATATMIIAGPILMGAPKDRPLADQGSGSGRRPEEVASR